MSGPSGVTTESSTSASTCVRVGLGVLLGDLRAVAGAVEDELFVAARLADRLDVGDACRRSCRRRGRPELRRRTSAIAAPATDVAGRVRTRCRRARAIGRCRAGRRRSDRAWRRSGRAVRRSLRRTGSPPAPARRPARRSPCVLRRRRAVAAERERDVGPATAPHGSSGTTRCAQAKLLLCPQGLNGDRAVAPAGAASSSTEQDAISAATGLRKGTLHCWNLIGEGRRCVTPAWRLALGSLNGRHTRDRPGRRAHPRRSGPYSHAVRSGELLFCSGQIPLDPATGEIVGTSAAEQARRCLENLAGGLRGRRDVARERRSADRLHDRPRRVRRRQRGLRRLLRGGPAGAGGDRRGRAARRALRSRSTRSSRS